MASLLVPMPALLGGIGNRPPAPRLYSGAPGDGVHSLVPHRHVALANGMHGPAGFATAAERLPQACSELEMALTAVVAEGELVVVQWQERGAFRAVLQPGPTHRRFEATGLNIHPVVDDLIVESWIGWIHEVSGRSGGWGATEVCEEVR